MEAAERATEGRGSVWKIVDTALSIIVTIRRLLRDLAATRAEKVSIPETRICIVPCSANSTALRVSLAREAPFARFISASAYTPEP